MQSTTRHSQFLDGRMPGMRRPRIHPSDEAMYSQPTIDIAEVGDAVAVEPKQASICQRLDEGGTVGLPDWLRANKGIIITGLALYGGYRLLRRRR